MSNIKKAFENAEKRTTEVLTAQNTAEAKDLFLGYLEEELAAANISPKKAEKLLKTATDYLNEKQSQNTATENAQNQGQQVAPVNYEAPKVDVKVYFDIAIAY